MRSNPFVSIIMPVYNCEKDVCRTIESIQSQTMKEWELIVVDDCSSDNTCDAVNIYAKEDSRITLIQKQINNGPGNSKNMGLKFAKGEYVTFCDGDDWVEENMLYEMSMNQSACEDVIIAGYYRDLYEESDELKSRQLVSMQAIQLNDKKEVIQNIPQIDRKRLFSFAWNKLYKKEIIDLNKVAFSDKHFGEDYDFNIAFFEYVDSMRVLDKGYYHYVKKNSESLTERYVPDFFEINKDRFVRMKKLMEDNAVYQGEIQSTILTAYIKHVIAAITRLHDPRAGLSRKGRRKLVGNMLNTTISQEAMKYAKATSTNEKICSAVFKTQSITLNILFGQLIWFVQTKGKKVFEKMKG